MFALLKSCLYINFCTIDSISFCSAYILLYDDAKRQQRFEYNRSIFRRTTPLTIKNNLRIISSSKAEKFKNIKEKSVYWDKCHSIMRKIRSKRLLFYLLGAESGHSGKDMNLISF